MEISTTNIVATGAPRRRRLAWRLLGIVASLLAVGIVAMLVSLWHSGLVSQAINLAQRKMPNYITINPLRIASHYLTSLTTIPESITLDVKHTDYQQLAHKREEAIDLGTLITGPNDLVPATLRWQGQDIQVKIRLKGDVADHWRDPYRWSFRVAVKDDTTVMGMREFSLQRPITRDYLNEWVAHQLFGQAGVVNLRYEFISLTVNGRSLGIYALEEHFSKELLEWQGYREGPILRFDDTLLNVSLSAGLDEVFSSSPIDSFQSGDVQSDPEQMRMFLQAKNLLELFRRGMLSTSQVFDVPKLAHFFAVGDLLGNNHYTYFPNVRFYYNPITSLLEPISYDINYIFDSDNEYFTGVEGLGRNFEPIAPQLNTPIEFRDLFFHDRDFFAAYIQALDEVAQPSWLDSFFTDHDPELSRRLRLLHHGYPWYVFAGRSILYDNQVYLQNVLRPHQALQAYWAGSSHQGLRVSVGNTQGLPLEVVGLRRADGTRIDLDQIVDLASKPTGQPIQFKLLEVPIVDAPQGETVRGWEVIYRTLGLDEERSEPVTPWSYLDPDFLTTDVLRQPPNVKDFVFLQVTDEVVTAPSGRWLIDRNLIIPAGVVFQLGPGTTLNLTNSATIISHAPLNWVGTAADPIRITSADATGSGVVVLNASAESRLEHVSLTRLSAPRPGNWRLTGALTFYNSPVTITDSSFRDNVWGDDYLNIVRSPLTLSRLTFFNTVADAIDIDASTGQISNLQLSNCGVGDGNGDCLDLSGSELELEQILISGAGDKGISVGEASHFSAETIEISDARLGIAVKGSVGQISGLQVTRSDTGVAVFQKKSEYGGGELRLNNFSYRQVVDPYLVEVSSRLTVDGTRLASNTEAALDLIYGTQQ